MEISNDHTKLENALIAGESFLAGTPRLSFVFKTNASGGIDAPIQRDTPAYDLYESIAIACNGISMDFFNEVFCQLEPFAIELGRTVSREKKDNDYFTTFSRPRF